MIINLRDDWSMVWLYEEHIGNVSKIIQESNDDVFVEVDEDYNYISHEIKKFEVEPIIDEVKEDKKEKKKVKRGNYKPRKKDIEKEKKKYQSHNKLNAVLAVAKRGYMTINQAVVFLDISRHTLEKICLHNNLFFKAGYPICTMENIPTYPPIQKLKK